MKTWRKISPYRGPKWPTEVDLWLYVWASPRSFGMSDSFRIPNAYKRNGKWFNLCNGNEEEIYADYITHWMPIPKEPKR